MNKNDLVTQVAASTGISKGDATKAIDAMFSSITEALKKGEEFRHPEFGGFAVSHRAESEGRNPRTGEKIKIAASKQVKFKVGKRLKDHINGTGGKAAVAKKK